VLHSLLNFAATEAAPASGGISALGLNVQGFIFQLITFVAVLLLLRKYAYGPLINTLESRRQAVEESLDQAKETAAELEKTRQKVAKMIQEARAEADDIVTTGHKESTAVVEAAPEKAAKQAENIVKNAHDQIQSDIQAARAELRKETAHLVAIATERIIGEKLDAKKDEALIAGALGGKK
jgi:F-type H+-transporting ATPase subunit b